MEIKILDEKPLLLPEVEKELKKVDKKDRLAVQELSYDFARKFSRLNTETAKKLVEEINNLEIPRVGNFHVYQIVTLMPKNLGELRSIFAGTKTTVTPENMKNILSIVKKYEK